MEPQRSTPIWGGLLILLLVAVAGLFCALQGSLPGFLMTTLCGAGLGILALIWLLPIGLVIGLIWMVAALLMRSGKARVRDLAVKNALHRKPFASLLDYGCGKPRDPRGL